MISTNIWKTFFISFVLLPKTALRTLHNKLLRTLHLHAHWQRWFITKKHLGELWTGVSPIKGTQGIHWLKPVSRISIQHKPYSLADSSNSTSLHFFEENSGEDKIDEEQQSHTRESLLVGSFARVKFLTKKSRKYFVAQITGVHSDGYTMTFLRRQGSTSLFINCDEEESYVEQDQIMAALPYPTLDNRNRCSFQNDIIAE